MVVGFIVFAIVICLVRGPREKGWFGWSGGWSIRRDDLPPKRQSDLEAPTDKALEEAVGGGSTHDPTKSETEDMNRQ